MINYKKNSNSRSRSNDIEGDMTPMIDMIFILLVFFVLTAAAAQNVFDVQAPKSDRDFSNEATGEYAVKVGIFEDGHFAINGKSFSEYNGARAELGQIFAARDPKTASLMVISDKSVPVERVMTLITFLRATGVEKIDILLEK